MQPVWAIARTQLRHRLRALIGLGLLAGIVGTAVLGAVAAARRTSTAYERLLDATHAEDARLGAFYGRESAEAVAALPSVGEAWIGNATIGATQGSAITYVAVESGPPRPADLYQPLLVAGRQPNPDAEDEILVEETRAAEAGLVVGDELALKLLDPIEFHQFTQGFGEPDGPLVTLRVVGLIKAGGDVAGLGAIEATPAYDRRYGRPQAIGQPVLVRLADGASFEDLRAGVEAIAADTPPPEPAYTDSPAFLGPDRPETAGIPVAATARVLIVGLAAFAAAAAMAGGLALSQALGRHHAAEATALATESALGLTAQQRLLGRLVTGVIVGSIAVATTAAGMFVVSRLAPLGSVARFEPHRGHLLDLTVYSAGGILLVGTVIALQSIAVRRATRRIQQRAPEAGRSLADRVATIGGGASDVIGLRLAFSPGRGAKSVPVRSAALGAVVGVMGVAGALAFAASLDRLASTPARYGWQGDFQVVDITEAKVEELLTDDRVAALAVVNSSVVRIGQRSVDAYAFDVRRGTIGWTMFEGRMPASPDEVAIGPAFAEDAGVAVGDELMVDSPGGQPHRFEIVGRGIGPLNEREQFGNGLAFTSKGLEQVQTTDSFREGLVRVAPGVDAEALARDLSDEVEIGFRTPPAPVQNLSDLGDLPALLGALLGSIALAAMGNALIVGVRRRGRDLAVLRTIGFVGRDLRRTVRVAALATTGVGLVIGFPLGLTLAGLSWRFAAESAYVASDLAYPAALLLVLPGALALALVLAAWPAREAAQVATADALRGE